MIESIEGKRGLPRHRPPYVAQVGVFGRPTLVNNVETLYWGPRHRREGRRLVRRPGAQRRQGPAQLFGLRARPRAGCQARPAGVTVRELIEEFSGGMAEGHVFKGYLPGGASGGILPASLGDLPLEFGQLEAHGCFVGSHAVVVLSDQDDIRAVARNLMRFFEDESCGQCTPCRVGTEKAVKLLERPVWDEALLQELGRAMAEASICGLGQAAANPIKSVLAHLPRRDRGLNRGSRT